MGLNVTLTDGRSFEVGDFKFSDMVAFEKHFQISSSKFKAEENRAEWMAFMLWRAIRRLDPQAVPDLEQFTELIDDIGETEELGEEIAAAAQPA